MKNATLRLLAQLSLAAVAALWVGACSGELIITNDKVTCSPEVPDGTCEPGKQCINGTCELLSCTDGEKNGTETAIDCGGDCVAACDIGQPCKANDDCKEQVCTPNPQQCSSTGSCCAAPSCNDNVQNGDETDQDCGGLACRALVVPKLCVTGQGCGEDADCATGVCDGNNLCADPSCVDSRINGGETDVDCGGATDCSRCQVDQFCNVASDCVTDACDSITKKCVEPSCSDLTKNGSETGVDCGGPCPQLCGTDSPCLADSDCQSDVCVANTACDTGFCCAAPSCYDSKKNGTETDLNCGGSCKLEAPPLLCSVGEGCADKTDCTTTVCQALICRDGTCGDTIQNGSETDTDCGGTCGGCQVGGKCLSGADCLSGVCDDIGFGLRCQAASCTDGVQNGTETDTDCGGDCVSAVIPSLCDIGQGCQFDTDCVSNTCVGGLCTGGSCNNLVKDNDETGIDCGGAVCPACPINDPCLVDSDCLTQSCDPTGLVCLAPTCYDLAKNGLETDLDCGGADCRPQNKLCSNGQHCSLNGDCVSGRCSGGFCAAASCNDGLKNQNETDVDCGGSCPDCANGKSCVDNTDCVSGICSDQGSGLKCQDSSCTDTFWDSTPGKESDIDCGGQCQAKCLDGQVCYSNADCAGGYCDLTASATCPGLGGAACTSNTDCGGTATTPPLCGHRCKTPLDITRVETERANRSQGIRANIYGSGFSDQVTVTLTLSTGGGTEGTDQLTFGLCSGTVDCNTSPDTKCYTVDPAGTQLVIRACQGTATADLTNGYYDVTVANATASDTADRAVLFAQVPAPTVTSVSPESAFHGIEGDGILSDQSVEIVGTNFQKTPLVEFININNPSQIYRAINVEYAASTRITAVVPSETQAMPMGTYWVLVTNPDGQAAYWLVTIGNLTSRGLFYITETAPPKITAIDPPRPPQGIFPLTFAGNNPLLITGENFIAPEMSGSNPVVGTGSRAYLLFPDGLECALPTVGLSCNDYTNTSCQNPTAGYPPVQYLAAEVNTPCGRGLTSGMILPVKVLNPDGQFFVYFSMEIYANSDGKLSSWAPGESLITARAYMGGTYGFDDLRSAYLYVAGGVSCSTSQGCAKAPNAWDSGSNAMSLLNSVEFTRVTPFGALNPWQEPSSIDPTDSTGARVPNPLNTPRAGLDLVRVGRWYYAIGGRSATSDGAPALATIERARILGLESRPGIQWARVSGAGSLPRGIYHYQVSAVSSEGEGLGTREVSAITTGPSTVTVQWESWDDPYSICPQLGTADECDYEDPGTNSIPRKGCVWNTSQCDPVPTSYIVYRSIETLGRPNSGQRLAYLFQPTVQNCQTVSGTDSGVTGCIQFTDDGAADNLITPSILSAQETGGGSLSGSHVYKISAYNSAATAVAGYAWNAAMSATGSYQLTWEHNPAADGYYVYRDGSCIGSGVFTQTGSNIQFTDNGSSTGTCNPTSPKVNPSAITRGNLSLWRTLPPKYNLRSPREGLKATPLSLPVPDTTDTRHFIYVVGGRTAAPVAAETYLASTERVEVDARSGLFIPVTYSSGTFYWDYERPDVTREGGCDAFTPNCSGGTDQGSCEAITGCYWTAAGTVDGAAAIGSCAANCINMAASRAYHSLTTTFGRFANEQPNLVTDDPCAQPDADGDGYNSMSCGGQDCNDSDPNIYPGAPEICGNGIDEDCSGADQPCDCSVMSYADKDGDGFVGMECCDTANSVCLNGQPCDCIDTNTEFCTTYPSHCSGTTPDFDPAQIYPGAPEICEDGIVQNCENCAVTDAGGTCPTGSPITCEEGTLCAYDCSSGDPSCGGTVTCDAATLASMDQDGDGYASAAYLNTPLNICCVGVGSGPNLVECVDCNDTNADVHPGALEICGNGVDEDCDGVDPACNCGDWDKDGYFPVECGGTDCVNDKAKFCALYGPAGSNLVPNCDVLSDAEVLALAAKINPGITGDSPSGPLCGNGIDDDCDGIDAYCQAGISTGPNIDEPVYLLASMGVSQADGSGDDTAGAADSTVESVVVEDEKVPPERFGHFVWLENCTNSTAGKLYNSTTCGVRGWESDTVPQLGNIYGHEGLTYYDYMFVHGGSVAPGRNPLSNPNRYPLCVVPGQFPSNPGDTSTQKKLCVGENVSPTTPPYQYWDMDEWLVCPEQNSGTSDTACQQSAGANMSSTRAFFVVERLFSYVFAIGGVSGSKWTPTATVERAGQ